MYGDLRIVYNFKGTIDEVLKKYKEVMHKCKLDWRTYDVVIGASEKLKTVHPVSYKLYTDVIYQRYLPVPNFTDIKNYVKSIIDLERLKSPTSFFKRYRQEIL